MPRSLALASLLAPLFAVGCAEVAFVKVSEDSRQAFAFAGGGDAASTPQDRYLRVQSKKKNKPGRMALVVPCDLWAPFRWEVSGGLYDPDRAAAADQAIFGTELDGRGAFPPTEFYGVSAQVTSGGLNAFAFTDASSSSIGSQFFAATTEIDFAIEATGTMLVFEARPTGTTDWTQIAAVPFSNQKTPLLPTVGVFNLSGKGVVGFDDWRLVSNGTEPGSPPAGHLAAAEIWHAACALVEAGHALDGIPDFSTADTWLQTAVTRVDAARATVDALPTSKPVKKARADLKKARKEIVEALARVANEKKEGKAIGDLKAAVKRLQKAADRVYDVVDSP